MDKLAVLLLFLGTFSVYYTPKGEEKRVPAWNQLLEPERLTMGCWRWKYEEKWYALEQ